MSDNQTFVRLALGGGMFVFLAGAVLICGGVAVCYGGSGAFVRFGMGTDLDEYREWVRGSDLSEADKSEVIVRMERIDEQVGSSEIEVPFLVWVDIDEEIERLASDRRLPPDELAALHDQLSRIESYR